MKALPRSALNAVNLTAEDTVSDFVRASPTNGLPNFLKVLYLPHDYRVVRAPR